MLHLSDLDPAKESGEIASLYIFLHYQVVYMNDTVTFSVNIRCFYNSISRLIPTICHPLGPAEK